MIIEIDAEINNQELEDKEYEQQLAQLQERIEQDFPWNEVAHRVERNEDIKTHILVTIWNKLNQEQVTWLNANTEIANWTWDPAGTLTVSTGAPTISTYPCEFHYEAYGISAELSICAPIGNSLKINNGRSCKVTSDEVLHEMLGAATIPLIGWTQTVWFCERCARPGATASYEKCPQCEQEYRAFMQVPMQDMLALFQTPLSPSEVLAQTKHNLQQELLSTQMQLRDLSQTPAEDRWMVAMTLTLRDDQSRLVAQITLISQIQADPAGHEASALEGLLRSLFRRVDEIEAALRDLPLFEDVEEDEVVNLDEVGQADYRRVHELQEEEHKLNCQIDLVARFLGVSARRICEIRAILRAISEDEASLAATDSPQVRRWIEGAGAIKTFSFPEHLASHMRDRPEEENIALVT